MKLIRNNIKVVVAFIIGLIISGTGVYAATILFQGDQVGFDNTTAGLQLNNQSVDNVQDAVDAIYTKTNGLQTQLTTCNTNLTTAQTNMVTYRDEICPGCVYSMHTTTKYNSNASSANGTNNVLSSSEYTTDYTTLNSNYFLGHVIDSNGYILASFACGINNNGTFFCLRGVDSDQSALTYKPFYQEGVNRMNKAFPSCNATTSGSNAYCFGGVTAIVNSSGYVYVGGGGGYCDVDYGGDSNCD